jgi:hypothetical protein
MLLTLHEPLGESRTLRVRNSGRRSLGELLAGYEHAISACLVDGEPCDAWADLRPTDERIELFVRAGEPISLSAILTAVISAVVGFALQLLTSLLVPRELGKETGRPEEVFGIAGLTNTVALGTPKFVVYGQRRVFGHIIATKVGIAQDGKTTTFGALYFMGEGEIEAITDVEINDAPLSSYQGASIETRLGTADQTPIRQFPSASQVYADGRELPMDPSSITYVTKGDQIDSVTLIFSLPFLFNVKQSTGEHTQTKVAMRIEYRKVGDPTFVEAPGSPDTWWGLSQGPIYRPFTISLPQQAQWEIRLRAIPVSGGTNEQGKQPSLFNVQEEKAGSLAYPNCALLAVFGVASSQIQSFESMRVSAMVRGRKVKIWDGASFTTAWTRQRAWIIRDLLTDARVGLGNKVPESLIDNDSFLAAQQYYDEFVDGEVRDLCDIIINDRRPGWDWLKDLLAEGRATLIPSGGRLKYVVERDRTPNLLYAMPGNIIEGSLQTSWGGQGSPPNVLRGEYPDAAHKETLTVIEVEAEDKGSEPERSELLSLRSIVRQSQAFRELTFHLRKRRRIKRRFRWVSPMTALVSEPFDVDSLSYLTVTHKRGVSGFVPAGSTTGNLLLDRLVTLEVGKTYSLVVRHLADNSVERRTIATAAGTWGQVQPTAAFATAPAEGDIWAIGEQNVHILDVLIERVARQDDGTYQIEASQYDPTLYESPGPPPPPPPETPPAPPAPPIPGSGPLPLPLADANVKAWGYQHDDGVFEGHFTFIVTPGQPVRAGTAQHGTSTTITLDAREPAIDDYYLAVPATITITSGTGAGQTRSIVDYTADRVATVSPAWSTVPDFTSTYEIHWGAYDSFWGFELQLFAVQADQPAIIQVYEGTVGDFVMSLTFLLVAVMIPIGSKGGRNHVGRWIIEIGPYPMDTTIPDDVTDWEGGE